MSVAIPNVLLTAHICSSYWAGFKLVMIMSFSDVTSSCFACKVGDWAMVKEMSYLSADLALIVFLPIGHSESRRSMV